MQMISSLVCCLCIAFSSFFTDKTLRLDYIFSGTSSSMDVCFLEASSYDGWAGRKTKLDEAFLRGNGQIELRDYESGKIIYVNPFSTLFQEWTGTEEATRVHKGFENCFQVPMPKKKVQVRVSLFSTHADTLATLCHTIDPKDILIRKRKRQNEVITLNSEGNSSEKVDVAIVAEGYTSHERDKFIKDSKNAMDALLSHEPMKSNADKFCFRAIFVPSKDSGVSVPHKKDWKETPFNSHYDTFYSQRYLTTSSMRHLYDALSSVPFEQIIILANTDRYGGGGIYNNLTLSTADNEYSKMVIVHEFGHTFAGLADEYFYDDQYESAYPEDTEPWEPNITTLKDFSLKWLDMLPKGTPIPTEPCEIEKSGQAQKMWDKLSEKQKKILNLKLGVYEGAGYQSKGVYRPTQECRMKINQCEEFCPVCKRAIQRTIDFYTATPNNSN